MLVFGEVRDLIARKPTLASACNGHIAVSHRRVGGNALDLTARRAVGFCLLFARVQRLHTLGPKWCDNLEIAHGLHTREIGK